MANSSPFLSHSCSVSDRDSIEMLGLGSALAQSLTLERDSTRLEINSDDEAEDRPAVEVGTNTEVAVANAPKEQHRKVPQSMLLRNLYVANLPSHVTARRLEELFAEFGKIIDVRLLLDIATGSSRGIGFVMFEEPSAARDAIAKMHRFSIDGRLIQVRFAERGADEKREKVVGQVVYARNVPATTTTEAIRDYFSRFGEVVEVEYHPQSHERGGPSPFNMTFIRFRDEKSADSAVAAVDGQAPFPLPYAAHPLIVAKVVKDVTCEMRKSIILRPRAASSEQSQPSSGGAHANPSVPPPLPSFPFTQSLGYPTPSPPSSRTATATSDLGEHSISFSRDTLPSALQNSLSPVGTSNLDSFGYATTLTNTQYSPVPQLLMRGPATPSLDSLSGSTSRGAAGHLGTPSSTPFRGSAMTAPLSPSPTPGVVSQPNGGSLPYPHFGQPQGSFHQQVQPQSAPAFRLQANAGYLPASSGTTHLQLSGPNPSEQMPPAGYLGNSTQQQQHGGSIGFSISPGGLASQAPIQLHPYMSSTQAHQLQAQIQQQVELQIQLNLQQQLQSMLQQQVQQQVQQHVQQQVAQQVQQHAWLQAQQTAPNQTQVFQLVAAPRGYQVAPSTGHTWNNPNPPSQWLSTNHHMPTAPQPIVPIPLQANVVPGAKSPWKRSSQ